MVMVGEVLFLVALDANLDDLFEHGGIFPADRSETGRWIQDGNRLNGLKSNSNSRNVSSGRNIDFYQATDDFVVSHRRPLV